MYQERTGSGTELDGTAKPPPVPLYGKPTSKKPARGYWPEVTDPRASGGLETLCGSEELLPTRLYWNRPIAANFCSTDLGIDGLASCSTCSPFLLRCSREGRALVRPQLMRRMRSPQLSASGLNPVAEVGTKRSCVRRHCDCETC